jgi:AcrR family transcriptional regulator
MRSEPAVEGGRRRRADARRSIEAILDAAIAVLAERPDASVEDVARAAGVSRQTVYAHYSSREELLEAVARRAMGQAVAAIDASRPDEGAPGEALGRLIDAAWQTLAAHARLLEAMHGARSAEDLRAFHEPILDRLEKLARRGRRAGEFDRGAPVPWLLATVLALSHAAAAEVDAGRVTEREAGRALRRSVARVFAAQG